MKKVSVIMPVSGGKENYLKEAVESVLSQTWTNLELILVDGSENTDKVKSLMKNIIDSRVRYYYREKNGIADALNYGIRLAEGDYIARMDADDISSLDRLKKQIEFLTENSEVDVVSTSFDVIDEMGKVVGEEIILMEHEQIKGNLIFGNPICHPSVMFRKKVFDLGWEYSKAFSEDYDLWVKMVAYFKFAVMQEKLLYYRLHMESASHAVEKVELSTMCSLKKYLKDTLSLETEQYEDEQFLLNSHLRRLKTRGYEVRYEYLQKQASLIKTVVDKNKNKHFFKEECLIESMKERWRKLLELFDVECNWNSEDLTNIKKKRDMFLDLSGKPLVFFLYGAGNESKSVIGRYEKLLQEKKILWRIEGVIDKKEKLVKIADKIFKTQPVTEFIGHQFDYIIITSEQYYDEMKKELLENGVQNKSILRESCLYCF